MNHGEVLIRAEHVSKKFCRSLKRSLWYGTQDIANALNLRNRGIELQDSMATEEIFLPALRKDEFWALQDVSFEVKRGECLGLIGHNGAGKSTLLKILNNLVRPDSGRITMRGRVGALIELNAGFNPILTGRENIYNQAALLGFTRKETDSKFESIVDFSELEEFLDMPLQNYSSGMRVKLGFAVSAQLEPDILIVDEVLAVGDVGFRHKCLNKMAELLNKCAVVFVSHSMPQVFRVCNEVMLLESGRCIFHSDDIGKGVEKYFEYFDVSTDTVTGTGDVKVKDIQLRSGNQVVELGKTLNIGYDEDVSISIKLHCNHAVRIAKLHFVVWNMELLPVLDIMGHDLSGFQFELGDNGEIRIETLIKNIRLRAGKYTVSAVINSVDNKKILCRHDSVAVINVNAESFSGAHILLTPDWKVK
ncbi:polysaccharide ABC transporter ATP-binding protein [Pseudomonadota bacterium]